MPNWIESLDIDAYTKRMMATESARIDEITSKRLEQVTKTKTGIQTKITAFGQLQSYFDTFQKKITSLKAAFSMSYQAASSDTSIATVALDGVTTAGTHELKVTQLAQAQSVASRIFTGNKTELNITETITVGIGSDQFNINVTSDDSLQSIAEKINLNAEDQEIGVVASVISTGSGSYRLVVSSKDMGIENAVEISETGTGSNALNIATGSPDTQVLTTAQNAEFKLDGLEFSLSGNSASVLGMKINLASIGTSTLSVLGSYDSTKAKAAAQDLVNSYNDMMTYIAKVQSKSSSFDGTIAQIQEKLKNAFSENSTRLALAEIGISPMPQSEIPSFDVTLDDGSISTVKPFGLLKIDNTLDTMLAKDFASVKSTLLSDESGFIKAGNQMTAQTGEIWILINGKEKKTGALELLNTQNVRLQKDIDTTKSQAATQKDKLIMKYAELTMMLSRIQTQNRLLSQQLAVSK